MTPNRAAILGLVALVSAALLASCGTKDLSREDFIAATDATCRNANEQLALIPTPSAAPSGSEDESLAAFLGRALEVNEQAADNIRALQIPDEIVADRERLVEAMDEANEALADAVDAAAEGDQDGLGVAVAAMTEGQNRFRELARRLGMGACVAGGVRGG